MLLLPIQHFATLIKKKKKKFHRFALLLTDGLLFRGAGVETAVPGHGTSPCSVWCISQTPRRPDTPGCSVRAGRPPPQQTALVLGLPQGEGRRCHAAPACSSNEPKWGGPAKGFYFNHSYLRYHSLSSGQTIAMATIISSNLYSSLIICSTFAKCRCLRVQFTFHQSVLLAHAAMLNVPHCTDTGFLMGWCLTIHSEDGFFC